MVAATTKLPPTEHLEQRIRETVVEAERWRRANGDPATALGAFLRDRYGEDPIMATYREYLQHKNSFIFHDYTDEPDEENGESL
jgi:hypothetical protein